MKILKITSIFFFVSLVGVLHGQPVNWSPISFPDHPANPRRLYYSENLEMTIYCGLFNRGSGSYYTAGYNGDSWVVLSDSAAVGANCAVDYENGVLLGGQAGYMGTQVMPSIAFYDGQNWSYPWEFNGSIRNLVWTNDTLFAVGSFTEIDGIPIYNIAKLVGDTWQPMINDSENFSFTTFNDIEFYEGKYYVSGNFQLFEGPNDLAYIEDMALHQVGEGLSGAWTGLSEITIFNDELYIAGKILTSQGNVGNHLIRWDGNVLSGIDPPLYYSNIGNDVLGGIRDMIVKDNRLYLSGSFQMAGTMPMLRIGFWDGSSYCSLFGNSFEQPNQEQDFDAIYCMGFFQDKVMVIRTYEYEDGTYDLFWLYEGGELTENCTDPLLSTSIKGRISFDLYPNPSATSTTIQSPSTIHELVLRNALGQEVRRLKLFSERFELDLNGLAPGLYLVEVITEEGRGVQKLVVE